MTAEERNRPEVKVTLDIRGFSCDHSEITRVVRIQPTRLWTRGEIVPRSIIAHKENHWLFDAPGYRIETLQVQVVGLLDLIEPLADNFLKLPSDARTQIYCAVYDYERSVDLSFTADTVRRAARISAEINVDYINFSVDQLE